MIRLAMEDTQVLFGDEIKYANSIEECLESSPVCVVTLMSKEYKNAIENLQPANPLTIIDCWRQIDVSKVSENVKIIAIGRAETENIANKSLLAGKA